MRLSGVLFSAIIYLILALASVPTQASEGVLSDWVSILSNNDKLCADFEQSKSLKALNRPLISRGNLIFMAKRGVLWQVRDPFPIRVLIKENEMIEWSDEGTAQRVHFGQSSLFHTMAEVFFAMFAGDVDALTKAFSIVSNRTGESWGLKLTPRDTGLAKIISLLEVTGGKFVKSLTIFEARGDKTTITFQHIRTDACHLGEAEETIFAH